MISRSVPVAFALGLLMTMAGCGNGIDESDITSTALPPPADAPKTPAEYDAKYPVSNAGDASRAKRGGPTVTNP